MSNTDGRALGLSHTGTLAMTVGLDPGISVVTVDLNCYPSTDYYQDATGTATAIRDGAQPVRG
jgi:hypothetical protein